tara:strand:- start:124 stop:843 length:720 start_codon:yes stop_codon:yes gene_type:complete
MKQTFRALLLAAGIGSRLKPFTLHTPKCLASIDGVPLLGRWLKTLEDIGCEAVLINTHHHAEQVENFIKNWKNTKMSIQTTRETCLLGTAGTLLANKNFFSGKTGMLLHADNFTNTDLSGFIKAHLARSNDCLLTMLTFNSLNPESCGIVETDLNGVVHSFYEKIKNPPSSCANGALYLFDKSFLEWLIKLRPKPTDFSNEVLPKLLNRIQTWHTNEFYLDIGTPDALKNAQKLIHGSS